MNFDTYGSAVSLKNVIVFDKFGFLTNHASRPIKGEVKDGKIYPLFDDLEAESLTNCNPTIQITSSYASEAAARQFKRRILSFTNGFSKNLSHSNMMDTEITRNEAGNLVYKNGVKTIYLKECFVKIKRVKWTETQRDDSVSGNNKLEAIQIQQIRLEPHHQCIKNEEQDALIINRKTTKKRMPFSPSKSITVSVDTERFSMLLKRHRSISEANYSDFAENPSITKDELKDYFIAKKYIAYKFRFPKYRVGSHPRSGMLLQDLSANCALKHANPYEVDPVDNLTENLVDEIILLQEGMDLSSTLELQSESDFDCIKTDDDEEVIDPEEISLDLTKFTGMNNFDRYLV